MTFKLYNRFITIFAQIYFFMDVILKYFPELSDVQKQQFDALQGLYEDWNSKINVISRKDIQSLYLKHILISINYFIRDPACCLCNNYTITQLCVCEKFRIN